MSRFVFRDGGCGYELALASALGSGQAYITKVQVEPEYDSYPSRYNPRYTIEVTMVGALERYYESEPECPTLEDRNRERQMQIQGVLSHFVKMTQVIVLAWADSLDDSTKRTGLLDL